MNESARLAGFFAAHGVWCVSDSGPLIPMLAYEGPDGSRRMVRFAAEALETGVDQGRKWLAENPDGAIRAVLVYDGYVTLPSGKTDALLIEVRSYQDPEVSYTMAVPYRNAEHPSGFAVYKPKFVSFNGGEPKYDELAGAFFQRVDQHEKGSAVWNRYIDQST
jgi:hypothetical protein